MTDNIFEKVRENINRLADDNVAWSVGVTHEEIERFINGDWESLNIFLPRKSWLPDDLRGKKILCLAGAGGQQAPLFASLGADVTVIDLSENMLSQDRIVAERENLSIRTEQGNMCDLSRFSDEMFDIIINPPSLMYVPDVTPAFTECYRVLKKRGIFIMCAPNPINFVCEFDEAAGKYIACNKLPYKSFEHENQGDWIEYGHTLESYIGGLTDAGFVITGLYENRSGEPADTDFTTRALKL